MANNCTLVEATDKAPPLLPPDFTTGTIVMIDMVNSDRKRLGPLQDTLLSHSARTYRHRMANDGLTIRVSSISEGGWHNAKHKVAHMRDPMCRLDGSMEVELFGKAKLYDRITLSLTLEKITNTIYMSLVRYWMMKENLQKSILMYHC